MYPNQFDNLIAQLDKLPGVGPRMAERLTLYLFKQSADQRAQLARAVGELDNLRRCADCFNIADGEMCVFCRDANRDEHTICVVEDSLDIIPIERTGTFTGRYHVLGGVLEHGRREERNKELTIPQLISRIKKQQVTEVILAMNPTTEGDYTISTLKKQLSETNIKITQLARGLATGSDIEHADDRTMRAALTHREQLN